MITDEQYNIRNVVKEQINHFYTVIRLEKCYL